MDTSDHPAIKLINSNMDKPDLDEKYMREYPEAPTNVLSKNSEEWRGLKFVYSAGHVAHAYAETAGWPKKRNSERECYQEVMPPIAHAIVLPWTWEGSGVFRAEYATTIDDRIANTMKQKYGEDLAIGPANTIGPFQSKRAATLDWEKAKNAAYHPPFFPKDSPQIAFTWPRRTRKEIPQSGTYIIWKK